MKAIFKNNYTWKSGSKCPDGMIGCAPESINFKKGDIFGGLKVSLSEDKKQVVSNMGNFSIGIPIENFTILNDDGIRSAPAIAKPPTTTKRERDLLNKQYQDAISPQKDLNNISNSVSKYVFNQDFEATTKVVKQKAVGDYTENIDYITLKYKFKKGDIFEGKKIPVNAGVNPEAKKYDIQITTPKSIKFDGSEYVGQVTYQIDDSLISEATLLQKNKTNLLIVGVLVLGYLAYKKFKK
jgi:hypothetical protein